MKKNYTIALFLFITAFFAVASCKKDNTNKPVIQLTSVDSSKTLTVTQGQTIKITLNDPGDGGYEFNSWQYDNSILKLDSHTHLLPVDPLSVGADEWQFTALQNGLSTLKITASRGSADTIVMFSGFVRVN
jgi:Chagasin family peptidase inhibitor I42